MKLHIGCGKDYRKGFINCDISPNVGADQVFDANETWPFEDSSVEHIECLQTLEHVSNRIGFFNEAWRVLKPGGTMHIVVPYGTTEAALADPTHVFPPIVPASFNYLRSADTTQSFADYGVECEFELVEERIVQWGGPESPISYFLIEVAERLGMEPPVELYNCDLEIILRRPE